MLTATITWTAPLVTDNWGAAQITEVSNYQPGDAFPIGVSAVTYTATDCSGNKGTFTFDVTIYGRLHTLRVFLFLFFVFCFCFVFVFVFVLFLFVFFVFF